MSNDLVTHLQKAREWLNGGKCCGQMDGAGICAAPACIFGEALKELDRAAAEITRLRAELATARRDALAEIKQDTDELIEQGRQDGMEEAAQIALSQPERIGEKLFNASKFQPDLLMTATCISMKREIAAAIRAAAKEVKP